MKKRVNITLDEVTKERLLQFGIENRIPGGLSGVIEFIAWNNVKVKKSQIKGQMKIGD